MRELGLRTVSLFEWQHIYLTNLPMSFEETDSDGDR